MSKSNHPQFFPSLACLGLGTMFHTLAIACKVLETTQLSLLFFPLLSFFLAQPNCTISMATLIFSLQCLVPEGHHSLSHHSLKISCSFFLFSFKSILCPQEAEAPAKQNEPRTLVMVPWPGFSFPHFNFWYWYFKWRNDFFECFRPIKFREYSRTKVGGN